MIRFDRVIVERRGQMVIDRLSLEVPPGATLAVIGRDGAGKSTLMEALATAIPIRGGDILIAGHSVRREPDAVRSRLGYVPAQLAAWPAVRADEFLALFGSAAGLNGHGLQAAVNRALDLAGLKGRGAAAIDGLPAGQAKLLLIGRALLQSPDLLVLDDPFNGLDPRQSRSVEQLIGDLQIGGRTVVAAIDDARVPDCFSQLAVLAEGRVVHQGPATLAAFSAGRAWRYRLICPGQAEAAAVVVRRLADHVEPLDATILDCTLESRPVVTHGSPDATFAEIVAAVVRAGISVEAAGLHPHWTEQLIEPLASTASENP